MLEQIRAENEQLIAIVNSLLLLARADTGQMMLDLLEVDLSDIALACVERLLPLAHRSRVALATGDLPEVLARGDARYLGQMLTNLNAIKYTGGVGRRVHIDLVCEQHLGIVRVQEDGPGIAEEHLPYLFERFYRVDKARSPRQKSAMPGGSGPGRSIVQWIAQAHSGEVRVESRPSSCSLFAVRLPLARDAEQTRGWQHGAFSGWRANSSLPGCLQRCTQASPCAGSPGLATERARRTKPWLVLARILGLPGPVCAYADGDEICACALCLETLTLGSVPFSG